MRGASSVEGQKVLIKNLTFNTSQRKVNDIYLLKIIMQLNSGREGDIIIVDLQEEFRDNSGYDSLKTQLVKSLSNYTLKINHSKKTNTASGCEQMSCAAGNCLQTLVFVHKNSPFSIKDSMQSNHFLRSRKDPLGNKGVMTTTFTVQENDKPIGRFISHNVHLSPRGTAYRKNALAVVRPSFLPEFKTKDEFTAYVNENVVVLLSGDENRRIYTLDRTEENQHLYPGMENGQLIDPMQLDDASTAERKLMNLQHRYSSKLTYAKFHKKKKQKTVEFNGIRVGTEIAAGTFDGTSLTKALKDDPMLTIIETDTAVVEPQQPSRDLINLGFTEDLGARSNNTEHSAKVTAWTFDPCNNQSEVDKMKWFLCRALGGSINETVTRKIINYTGGGEDSSQSLEMFYMLYKAFKQINNLEMEADRASTLEKRKIFDNLVMELKAIFSDQLDFDAADFQSDLASRWAQAFIKNDSDIAALKGCCGCGFFNNDKRLKPIMKARLVFGKPEKVYVSLEEGSEAVSSTDNTLRTPFLRGGSGKRSGGRRLEEGEIVSLPM